MMGVQFSEKFLDFLSREKGMEDVKLSVVKSNPGQSKHLETAKVNPVLGFELDLVNLRSEEYAEGSRIPTEVVSSAISRCLRDYFTRCFWVRHLGLPYKMLYDETSL
jgi:hypothetical protein